MVFCPGSPFLPDSKRGHGMADGSTKKLIALGAALAIPLAAVALYFAIFVPATPPPAAPAAAQTGGLPPNHPTVGGQESVPAERHPPVAGAGRAVRVPEEVKGKWQAVKLQVEQRNAKTPPQVFTVKLGETLAIPGSRLRVEVGEFLPALQVKDNEVTSASNEPTNPAVHVLVSEDGREAFRGWLFAKFPEMQPFEHPDFRITLQEGVPKR